MVRKYKKRIGSRTYINYTSETVSEAVRAIRDDDVSVREASRRFRIPYGTLYNKVNGLHTRKNGGQTTLSPSEEEHLCVTIQFTGEWGYPL